ncbi:hypothetical protein K440DRAFT_661489 [Wilcoxina mikolae CBS 423.85]|nr:hypothetical protein K440DRAFT_661489 [Wilcoxina mikolae CBS 423.85]
MAVAPASLYFPPVLIEYAGKILKSRTAHPLSSPIKPTAASQIPTHFLTQMVQKMVGSIDPTEHRFTSVAFAHTASPEEVKLVQTWPKSSTGNSSADQVPTEIHYTNQGTRTKLWGYETSTVTKGTPIPDPLKWFKLLLQERSTQGIRPQAGISPRGGVYRARGAEARLSNMFGGLGLSTPAPRRSSTTFNPPTTTPAHKTAQKLQLLNMSAVTVVTDFLSAVRTTTVESIERTYDAEWVRESKIEYVLTVPAIWSDSAKSLMVQAAKEAGFGTHRVDFNLVSEPEAAAAHALKVIQPHNLNCGDTFVICDAGGGTVDLISYKITNLKPLKIVESVSGSGDLCGSVFLDEGFEQYIRKLLGDEVIDGMKQRSRNEMMRTWVDKAKSKFNDKNSLEEYEVTMGGVPDDDDGNVEAGFHYMQSEQVKKIFDPIVDYIVELVKEQVLNVQKKGENVAAILLVGGFGSSEYLLKRLQHANYGIGKPLQVLQPMNAQTAIARGALLRGLDGSIVKERRARKYYGCDSLARYEAGKGLEAHKYWCNDDEAYFVPGNMKWYITRNMVLKDDTSISMTFYCLVSIPTIRGLQPQLQLYHTLLGCDLDNAPDFKWKNPDVIRNVCTLHSDLSRIPTSKFTVWSNSSGERFYKITYDLKMSLISEVLKFEMVFQGDSYGEVYANFESMNGC